MMKFFRKFDDMMSAVAFAEEGEFDTARQIMKESDEVTENTSEKCPHCGGETGIHSMPEPYKA